MPCSLISRSQRVLALFVMLAVMPATDVSALTGLSSRAAAPPDSSRVGYWGPWPVAADSTTSTFGDRPRPAWETAAMVPYWIAGLPFRIVFFAGDQAVTGLDKLNLFEFKAEHPGLPGPFGSYIVPALTVGELEGTAFGLEATRPRFLNPDGQLNLQASRSTRHADALSGGIFLPLGDTGSAQLGFGTDEVNLHRFYGLGGDSRVDDRSYYSRETQWLGLGLDRNLFSDLSLGFVGYFSRIANHAPEYELEHSILDVHAGALPFGFDGRSQGVTLRFSLDWNDTQQTGRPDAGAFRSLAVSLFRPTDGADAGHLIWHLASERFFPLWHTDRTLAIRGFLNRLVPLGDAGIPFTRLISTQRPDFLRGFPPNRFLGYASLGASVEYRWPIWRPRGRSDYGLDAYLFCDAGQVYRHTSELGWDDLRTSGGFGLRYIDADRNLGARIEIAFSNEEVLFGFKLSQTFQYEAKGLMYGKNPTKVY